MRSASGDYHDLAGRLLAHEAGSSERPPGLLAAERLCTDLQGGLAKLVGPAGFEALVRRALHLARVEHPLLEGVQAFDGTCLEGLAERAAGQPPDEVSAAVVSLFEHFLSLLSSFIGEDLVRRQVRRIWPEVPLDEAVSGAEEARR